MTNKNIHINCPTCNETINIKEAIAKNLENDLHKEELTKIRSEEAIKAHKVFADTIKSKDDELLDQSSKIIELNTLKSQIQTLQRKNKEVQSEVSLQYEEKLNEEMDKKNLEISDGKIQINQLRDDLIKLEKRASQGSVQLQGESKEKMIEEWLQEEFPEDEIKEVKKGIKGADTIHKIVMNGETAGRICIESKRTNVFQNSWIEKVKDDAKDHKCQIALIVTDALPKNLKGYQLNAVWICTFSQFKILIHSLRLNICELSNALNSHKNRTDKTSLLFNYITSLEFKQEVETIVSSFISLEEDLEREKKSMQSLWSKRSKLHTSVVKSTTNIYGSLKGIAGNSIKSIDQLELPSPDNKILEIINTHQKKGKK